MKHHAPLLSLLVLFAVQAFAQISAPLSGFVRYGALPIQKLFGVPGNLVPVPAGLGSATAISFSDHGALIAQNGRVRLLGNDGSTVASYDTPESSSNLSIGRDLTSAVAWLPSTHLLLWSNGKTLSAVTVDDSAFEGRVTSLSRVSPQAVRFLLTHPDGSVSAVTVSLPGGDLISSDILPGVRGPAFSINSETFWVDEDGLQIESATSARRTLAFPSIEDLAAEQMSSHWLHLFSASAGMHWVLRLGDAPPILSRIPAPALQNSGRHLATAEASK
ncbi:MAG: hypothetical protein M3Y24_03755 [Acidobacteriota bacterium]|nr:hypothetical protein [Acidobacteriota bacterium]